MPDQPFQIVVDNGDEPSTVIKPHLDNFSFKRTSLVKDRIRFLKTHYSDFVRVLNADREAKSQKALDFQLDAYKSAGAALDSDKVQDIMDELQIDDSFWNIAIDYLLDHAFDEIAVVLAVFCVSDNEVKRADINGGVEGINELLAAKTKEIEYIDIEKVVELAMYTLPTFVDKAKRLNDVVGKGQADLKEAANLIKS